MGGLPPTAGGSHKESCIALHEGTARSSNLSTTFARFHKEGEGALENDYDVVDTPLGMGMNGTVLLAFGYRDGRKYAVKRLPKQGMSAEEMKFLQREVEIYLSCDHPGIAQLIDVYETSQDLMLVMECCTGGELLDRVLEQTRLVEPDAAAVMQQMLRVVSYLHSHQITHRDLKPENFLFQSRKTKAPLKLIDFGFAKVWNPGMPKMRTCCGTFSYVSPEVLSGQGYTSKCDLWSVGVIAYMMLSGYMPFFGDQTSIKQAILAGKVNWHCKALRNGVSEEAINFVKGLLTSNPERRLDASMALAHPWLARFAPVGVPRLSEQVALSLREYAGAPRLRRAALQLLARDLLPEESRELSELFLGLDGSGSGTVSVHELAGALCELKREQAHADFGSDSPPWSTPEKAGHWALSSASTVDTDLQGCSPVSFLSDSTPAGGELEKSWLPESTSSTSLVDTQLAEAEMISSCLDASGDGEVYCSDFIAAALGSRPRLCEQAIQRTFARLDADRSGSIGAEDLRRVLGGSFEEMEPGMLLASAGVPLDARGEVSPHAFAGLLRAGHGNEAATLGEGPPHTDPWLRPWQSLSLFWQRVSGMTGGQLGGSWKMNPLVACSAALGRQVSAEGGLLVTTE